MHALTRSAVAIVMAREYDDGSQDAHTAMASSFVWTFNGNFFLVTNWHNVTGKNPVSGDYLGDFTPNFIIGNFLYIVSEEDKGRTIVQTRPGKINLYDAEGAPNWIEHPHGCDVDCVAIPLDETITRGWYNLPINDSDVLESQYNVEVGDECFILGFPKGLSGRLSTPIWKRGSIASEPELDHDRKPIVLVDSASRKGMSGSAVIARHDGVWSPTGAFGDGTIVGTVLNFVGIYSGRTDDDELGVQIGRVWKRSVIDEIFDKDDAASVAR